MASKKITYKKNFLDNVILRLDFEKTDLSKLSDFSSKLKADFPFQEAKTGFAGQVKIDIKNNLIDNNRQEVSFWEYLNTYKNKKLRIAADHLIIEYTHKSYVNADNLIKDAEGIVQTFINEFNIQSVNRLGLRYVNRFDLSNFVKEKIDWKKYFNNDVVAPINFSNKTGYDLARCITQNYLKLSECDILLNYGIWNQDFPNENVGKEFLLDIDCFSRFPLERTSDISKTISSYNSNIQKIFEKSIKEETRKLMQ